MIPSLSTRLAEPPGRKDAALLDLPAFGALARDLGYVALSMRASQVAIDSPPQRVTAARQALQGLGLAVSLVTGTVSLAANDAQATAPLRHITPHLDLAQGLGCTLVRVMLQREDDLPWARRAAAEAAERGLRLAHQTHVGTLLETVDEALDVVARVGHPAFGLTYEPSNLLVCDSPYGPEAIRRLAPHILNVYLQNWHRHPGGAMEVRTRGGLIRVDQVPLDDRRGIDLEAVFQGLRAIGWRGYVTVHQTLLPGEEVPDAAARHLAAIRPYLQP
ncbi:MAG TPA: sugar phosphate isomerase/epimerase [Chloroflexota bacterium]|nr:sugar phosphate isomerase/epimerase [Chloroflexota bacterium]